MGTVSAATHLAVLLQAPLPAELRTLAGMALYAAGLGLFGWAWQTTRHSPLPIAFSTTPSAQIVTSGLYRLTRHPFYAAYSLTWLAGCSLSPTPAVFISTSVMITGYVIAARGEERRLLTSELGETYRRYRRR